MKCINKIRKSTTNYPCSEAYAQYLYMENKEHSFENWLDFNGARINRRKIAKPLYLIMGGVK